MNPQKMKRIRELGVKRSVAVYAFLGLYALAIIVPLVFMYNSSLRTTREIFEAPLRLATDPQFSNYTNILVGQNFLLYLANSVVITAGAMVLNLALSTGAAYALARYKFRISGLLYSFFLLGSMVPLRLASLPLFLLMRDIGILDTRLSLIIVYAAWRFGFSILIFYGFFFALPAN